METSRKRKGLPSFRFEPCGACQLMYKHQQFLLRNQQAENAVLKRKLMDVDAEMVKLTRKLAEAREEATIDDLTGIANRRGFDAQLTLAIANAMRGIGKPLSLAVFDLDYFKKINDTYGHPAGDAILKRVGEILRHFSRASDFVARIGGEEFAFILQGTDENPAVGLINRLRQLIEKDLYVLVGTDTVQATASFGVAQWHFGEDTLSLYKRADQALYEAKGAGRNRVAKAPPPTRKK